MTAYTYKAETTMQAGAHATATAGGKGTLHTMTALSPHLPPRPSAATTDADVEARALVLALERAGFPTVLRIGAGGLSAAASPAQFALHLPRPLPLDTLLYALSALRGARSGALLLTTDRASAVNAYREHLKLDANGRVLAIARKFRPAPSHALARPAAPGRPKFLAAAWKIDGPFRSFAEPQPGHPWQSARTLIRMHRRGVLRFPADPASAAYFVGPPARPRPIYHFFKRVFDIAFAAAALLATLPICLVVAIIIKLYDRGPVFFSHKREGLHGRPFGCMKFRTMVRNAHTLQATLRDKNNVDGPQFKIAYDPRITPIGHFLRKTNIDELPQFLNVLAGHMSVVGPRPSPFNENQLCPPWREARLSVKPGITGLWQVSRSRQRGAADFQEWIMYDTQYVERRSMALDIKILLLTIKELFGKGQ
jgi:lipopolysaccharide/colanic/teichoic acid biosynthesis glycosyltransferase